MVKWMQVVILTMFNFMNLITAQNDCYDLSDYWACYSWYLRGTCENPIYYQYMFTNCRKTCNLCPEVEVKEVTRIHISTDGVTCKDNRSKCLQWLEHCSEESEYFKFMSRNCQRSCKFCFDKNCVDRNKKCKKYEESGYCDLNHKYFKYMNKTCPKSCKFCMSEDKRKKVKEEQIDLPKKFFCSFEEHTCDWENQHFEDGGDWEVGILPYGPQHGPKNLNDTSYLYLDAKYTDYDAKLWLPWMLVLSEKDYRGPMCLRFDYYLTGGTLSVIENKTPTLQVKFPAEKVVFRTNKKNDVWKKIKVQVDTDDSKYLLVVGKRGEMKTFITIDDLFFTEGVCH